MIGTFGIKEAAAAEAAEEGEAGFQLLVVNFAGTTVTLDGCLISDTIDAVAGAFATKLNLPERIVRLMLEGTQLDAEYTLAHYQITAGCQLHALPRLRGGVGVAAGGGGSKKRAADDGAAAGGGGPAPKKRTRKHAAAAAASGPSAGSRSVGGSGSGSKGQQTLTAWAGRRSDDGSPSDGREAAAAEAAEREAAEREAVEREAAEREAVECEAVECEAAADEAAADEAAADEAAADEGITPEEGLVALRGAVDLFPKSKPENLPLPPLIEATRATDFGPAALTSSSSREDIKAACKSLASKLASLKYRRDLKEQRDTLVLRLRWPSAALLEAFAKELRAGEAAPAALAMEAMEAVVAERRRDVARLVIAPTEATGRDACVKMKELFRHIRTVYPNVSATELER